MAWGEWLVPRLSLSAEAQLRSNVAALEREGRDNVDQLVRIACALAQQNALQAAIIRQAIGHISHLEMEIELGGDGPIERPSLVERVLNLFRHQ